MSVTVDNRTSGTSTTGATSITFNHTVSAGLSNSILLVFATTGAAVAVSPSGINWDQLGTPTALTQKGTVTDSAGNCKAEIWYLKSPSSGTKQIKISTASSVEITGGAASYSGVDQTTTFNAASPQTSTGTATASLPGLSVTTANGEMVVDCVTDNHLTASSDVGTPGASQTKIYGISVGSANHSGFASDQAATGSTATMSWTGITNTNTWGQVAVSLKVAAAGGGTVAHLYTLMGVGK